MTKTLIENREKMTRQLIKQLLEKGYSVIRNAHDDVTYNLTVKHGHRIVLLSPSCKYWRAIDTAGKAKNVKRFGLYYMHNYLMSK